MKFAENYFKRYKTDQKIFADNPRKNTGIIVVIPVYNEDEFDCTLNSLEHADKPNAKIEVIVVINSSEITPKNIIDKNEELYNKLINYNKSKKYKSFSLLPHIVKDISKKFAGVGNARKIGMDEALRRFSFINNQEGLIVSLDADTKVSEDYFTKLEEDVIKSDKGLAIFQFQHDFNEEGYSKEVIQSCMLYETYLRYFRLALKWSGFPYAIHTIGSCFAVRADVYAKAGGMSRRQGGEDFYFLHKTVVQTKYIEINKPIVFPSPRPSDRVPFGTGPAVNQIMSDGVYRAYNFKLFKILKKFFNLFDSLYKYSDKKLNHIPDEVVEYFGREKISQIIDECLSNTSSQSAFVKRMFSKFDAFQIIKFLNSFDSQSDYPPRDILDSTVSLLKYYNVDVFNNTNLEEIYQKAYELDIIS